MDDVPVPSGYMASVAWHCKDWSACFAVVSLDSMDNGINVGVGSDSFSRTHGCIPCMSHLVSLSLYSIAAFRTCTCTCMFCLCYATFAVLEKIELLRT